MIIIPTLSPRHVRKKTTPAMAGPASPVLIASTYDPGGGVTLTFDRGVDVSGFDVATLIVNDGDTMGFVYQGFGVDVLDPTTISVSLNGIVDGAEPGTWLTVAADNGIVAADGALPWTGVTELELPFGT